MKCNPVARRTITGTTYRLTLPTPQAARDFARATTELTRQGFSRDRAVRRLADRINVKLIHPLQ